MFPLNLRATVGTISGIFVNLGGRRKWRGRPYFCKQAAKNRAIG